MTSNRRPRALVAWSSGKDSAWALHRLRQTGQVEVVGLLTTFNQVVDRVAMHAVRRELVEAQADAVGLPLIDVQLPWPCSDAEYDGLMASTLDQVRSDLGVTQIAFGDLFLQDVRAYRESRLHGTGVDAVFPLWGLPTADLAREMITAGLEARVACIDPASLEDRFVGRSFDLEFLDALPGPVDPCGERGEFHTFCHAGPMFGRPVPVSVGEMVRRGGYVFCDLVPSVEQRPGR